MYVVNVVSRSSAGAFFHLVIYLQVCLVQHHNCFFKKKNRNVFVSGVFCFVLFFDTLSAVTATTLSASSAPATEKCPGASHSSTSMR